MHVLNRWIFAIVLCVSVLRGEERLDFRNGDAWSGVWSGVEGNHLLFRPAWLAEPRRVPFERVRALRGEGTRMETPEGDVVVLRLRGGGQITGTLIAADGDQVEIQSVWGQVLRIRRSAIRGMDLFPDGTLLWNGPGNVEDWKRTDRVRSHSLQSIRGVGGRLVFPAIHAQASLRLPLSLTKRFYVETVFTTAGLSPRHQINVLQDPGTRNSWMHVHVVFTENQVLLRWPSDQPDKGLESATVPIPGGFRGEQTLRTYVDIEKKTLAIFLQGKLLKVWKSEWLNRFSSEGESQFTLQTHPDSGPFLLSRLRYVAWDGGYPEMAVRRGKGPDRLLLKRGEWISGTWLSADSGSFWFLQEGLEQPTRFPFADLRGLECEPLPEAVPSEKYGYVYAGAPGDRFRLLPESFDGEILSGSAPGWLTPPMIPSVWLDVLTFEGPDSAPTAPPAELARMMNGDQSTLKVLGLRGGQLVLRFPWEDAEVMVPARHVGHLQKTPSVKPNTLQPHAVIRMTNGDTLRGDIQALDEKSASVLSPWAQGLTLKRGFIDAVVFYGEKERLTHGLGLASDWIFLRYPMMNSVLPLFTGNSVVSVMSSHMSRQLPVLPRRFKLDVVVRPESPLNSFLFSLSALPPGDNQNSQALTFILGRNQLVFALNRAEGGHHQSWNLPLINPSADLTLRLALLGDLDTREFQFWINGLLANAWEIPESMLRDPEKMRWFSFSAQYVDAPIHLEQVSLTAQPQWTGMEELPALPGQSMLLIRNGDTLAASTVRIHAKNLELTTPEGVEVTLPISRVNVLHLPEEKTEIPRRTARDVTLCLADDVNRLTLPLLAMDEQDVIVGGEMWEEPLRIPRTHISRIAFNIHRPVRRDETIRENSDWMQILDEKSTGNP